ncbi:transporter, partial [Rhodococcus wratislaviensis]
MRSVQIKLMTVAVIAAFASAACGSGGSGANQPVSGGWDDIVAAAKGEGSVLLYSSQKPANLDALKVAFEQEYPEI